MTSVFANEKMVISFGEPMHLCGTSEQNLQNSVSPSPQGHSSSFQPETKFHSLILGEVKFLLYGWQTMGHDTSTHYVTQ
jgi:hypothetical protein